MLSTQLTTLNYPVIFSHWHSTTVFLETYQYPISSKGLTKDHDEGVNRNFLLKGVQVFKNQR